MVQNEKEYETETVSVANRIE